jgi:hypothetical protein
MLIGQETWSPKNQLLDIASYHKEELLAKKIKGKITLHFLILKLNTSHVIWFRNLLKDLGEDQSNSTILNCVKS